MKTTAVVTLLILASSANPAEAATVAVYPIRGTNIEAGLEDAVGMLLADAYADTTGRPVLDPDDVRAVFEAMSAEATAIELGLTQYIVASVVRLNAKLTMRAILYEADGAEVFRTSMTAASVDDLEQVTERLALALHHRRAIVQTRTINNVTKTEGKVPNKTFSEKVLGVKTQFVMPVAKGQSLDMMISVQFNGRFEGESYFLEFGAGFLLPTGAIENSTAYGALIGEIGASWYLYDEDISPYLGAGLSPRLTFTSDDALFALAPFVQGGFMFFRESSTRLYADLRVAQNVIPYRTGFGDSYFPTEFMISIGIGW